MSQTKAIVGMGTSPWHQALNKRVRFVADINGREEVVVGRVKKVSTTGALMRVGVESENAEGKKIIETIEYPTALIRPGSFRQLMDGQQA